MLVRRNLKTLKKTHFDFSLSYFGFRKVQQFSRGMVLMITCFKRSFYTIYQNCLRVNIGGYKGLNLLLAPQML